MNSFSDYEEGSATAAYRQAVDRAVQIAEEQKRKTDPIHHEKIDRLLDAYARRLAENINQRNAIASRVPSILISGGGNFPVRKKGKQNRAADANLTEWQEIQGLLDKIRSTGKGGINADDPEAVQKLKAKQEELETLQNAMKAVNAYYRKHKTLDGCPGLSAEEIEKLNVSMAQDWRPEPKPFPSFQLANNNAAIRQVKERIAALTAQKEKSYMGWRFAGGVVEANREANRLQIFFDEKPDAETRTALKREGFRWAPSAGAWQRQLSDNAFRATKRLECIRPVAEEPSLQRLAELENDWRFYIIADLKTWADNAENRSPLEYFSSFEEAKARFQVLRSEDYNAEVTEPAPDGRPPARLTLGIQSADGCSAVDVLHVRQGKNYLVTDFTQIKELLKDPAVSEILCRVSKEIDFDLVQPPGSPAVPFALWDNPYFPAGTPGSIAAAYCELLHECYLLPKDESLRDGQISEIIQYLQRNGRTGAKKMVLAVTEMAADHMESETVRKWADRLMAELAQYSAPKEKKPQKERRKKPPER